METRLTIDETSRAASLKLAGDLTIQHASALREILLQALEQSDHCVLDLEEVLSFDLSAIQVLFAFHSAASRMNKQLELKSDPPRRFSEAVKNAGFAWQNWFGLGQDASHQT